VVNWLSAAAATPLMSIPPSHEVAGAPIASRSCWEARSRITLTGGLPGSTAVVDGTPASSAMRLAPFSTCWTRLGLMAAVV
jgi:hypothetical protein